MSVMALAAWEVEALALQLVDPVGREQVRLVWLAGLQDPAEFCQQCPPTAVFLTLQWVH